jgi:hypothetical protein
MDDEQRVATERAEIARLQAALKEGTVVTKGQRRLACRAAAGVLVVVVLGAVAIVGRRVAHRMLARPCDDAAGWCVGADRAQICVDGEPHTMRCKSPCNPGADPLCGPVDDPVAGEACQAACASGYRAMPEEQRCSADGTQLLDCTGCAGLWWVVQTCGAGQVCDINLAGMRPSACVPRR